MAILDFAIKLKIKIVIFSVIKKKYNNCNNCRIRVIIIKIKN